MNSSDYNGQTGWHLASSSEITNLFTSSTQALTSNFLPNTTYYTTLGNFTEEFRGRIDVGCITPTTPPDPAHGYAWVIGGGDPSPYYKFIQADYGEADNYGTEWLGAWVTTDVAPTPIPPSFILMGSGLVGMVGYRRRLARS
jgi:hypothetical protein